MIVAKAVPLLAGHYLERFLSRIAFGPNRCWEWKGSIDAYGYGRFCMGTAPSGSGANYFKAHRLSYAYFIGDMPSHLTIDHLCRNHACVNPLHLDPVPSAVNVGRGRSGEVLRLRNQNQYWWTPEARAKIAASNRRRRAKGAAA